MADQQLTCPGCASTMRCVADRGVRYECSSCQGRLLGLSPFERALKEGVGARIWVSANQSGTPGPACPFCGNAMRQPPAAPETPAGIAVCHTCEQVWVPPAVTAWLDANAGPGTVPLPAVPAECSNCGAPFQPDERGQCRFCHAQIGAPAEPVLIEVPASAEGPRTGSRLLDALTGLLTESLD